MVGQRDKKSTRHCCLSLAIHTHVITRDAVDDQVVRVSSLCLRGGTSYVFAGSFWGRRPEVIAAENSKVPPRGTPFHTPHFCSHLDAFASVKTLIGISSQSWWRGLSSLILLAHTPFICSAHLQTVTCVSYCVKLAVVNACTAITMF